MRPVKEGDHLRVSRNFITDHQITDPEELTNLSGRVMLCTDVGTFRPAFYFRRTYNFERLYYLIKFGYLYLCKQCPLASRPLKDQYNWELAYSKFRLAKLIHEEIYYGPDSDQKKTDKSKKLLNMKIIKYTTLLRKFTHSEGC